MRIRLGTLRIGAISIFALASCARAQETAPGAEAPVLDDAPHGVLRIVSEHNALVPGQVATIAVSLELEKDWHTYWRGYSDSGMPPRITLKAPEGYQVEGPRWPAPVRHVAAGDVLDHIYEQRLVLVYSVRVPPDAPLSTRARFEASGAWLVCKSVCVPEEGAVDASFPIAAARELSGDRALIDGARSRWARPIGWAGARVSAKVEPGVLRVSAPKATRLTFIPDADCAEARDLLGEGRAEGPTLEVRLGEGEVVSGLIEAVFAPGSPPEFYEIRVPCPPPPHDPGPGGGTGKASK